MELGALFVPGRHGLFLRFYAVDSGRIMIDGQDIATVSRASLRRQTAYVG